MSAPHPRFTVRLLTFVITLAMLKLRDARRDQVALALADMPTLDVVRVRMSHIEVAIFIVVVVVAVALLLAKR